VSRGRTEALTGDASETRIVRLGEDLAALRAALDAALTQLATPCLVVLRDRAEANSKFAAERLSAMGVRVRPHAKAHKCSELLRLQLAAGNATGVTCATAFEAEQLASRGFVDILIANEVVSQAGMDAIAAALQRRVRVTTTVDTEIAIDAADEAARRARRRLGVLVDLDVGSHRCGVDPHGRDVVSLAKAVQAREYLTFEGLMAYSGKANFEEARGERRQFATEIRSHVNTAMQQLRSAGFTAPTVSGGSTGLWEFDQGLTEVQIGSYVLMDARYATVDTPFQIALVCAATVISINADGRVILDCGWKALSAEYGLPACPPGLSPVQFSDEHLICQLSAPLSVSVGDVVLVAPAHLDPTVNLHDRLVVIDHGALAGEYRVDLRREGSLIRPTAGVALQ
jgi:D-serine deaminase-like pyridoxal phosphate-dependent protein